MAIEVSLLTLRTKVLQVANMEFSTFISADEINGLVNSSWCELYELLIGGGQEFFLNSYDISTTSGTDTYALPDDFYKLRGVDANVGGFTFELRPFMFNERNMYKNAPGWNFDLPVAYRVVAGNIKFVPVPNGVNAVTLWYYPAPVVFVGDTDTQDFVAGWDEYVIVDAAIKCLRKEESDVSVLMAQKAALADRIAASAAQRDAGYPERVTDTDNAWQPNRAYR